MKHPDHCARRGVLASAACLAAVILAFPSPSEAAGLFGPTRDKTSSVSLTLRRDFCPPAGLWACSGIRPGTCVPGRNPAFGKAGAPEALPSRRITMKRQGPIAGLCVA